MLDVPLPVLGEFEIQRQVAVKAIPHIIGLFSDCNSFIRKHAVEALLKLSEEGKIPKSLT